MQLQELAGSGSQLRRERAWRRGQRNRLRIEERGAEHPETRYLAPEDAADVLHGALDALRVLAFAKPEMVKSKEASPRSGTVANQSKDTTDGRIDLGRDQARVKRVKKIQEAIPQLGLLDHNREAIRAATTAVALNRVANGGELAFTPGLEQHAQ